jgi:hypothetical protein
MSTGPRIEAGWGGGSLVIDDRVGFAVGIELAVQPLGGPAVERPYELGVGVDLRPPDGGAELPAQLQIRFGVLSPPPQAPPPPQYAGGIMRALAARVGCGPQLQYAVADPDKLARWGADFAASTMFETAAYGMPTMEELHVLLRFDVAAAMVISKRALLLGSMTPERFNGFQMAFNGALRWDPVHRQRPQPPVYAESYFCAPGPHLTLRAERVAELGAMHQFLASHLAPAARAHVEGHLRMLLAGGDAPDDPFLPQHKDIFVSAFANAADAAPVVAFFAQQLAAVRVMRDMKGLCLYWLRGLELRA